MGKSCDKKMGVRQPGYCRFNRDLDKTISGRYQDCVEIPLLLPEYNYPDEKPLSVIEAKINR
jgi:hypothetical protein